jgi:phosphopantothenoylcysteine synthetase/decarboxylase
MEGREFPMPFALVTCGPAHEPIDEVRRITNHSTGELGTMLAETLSSAGFDVLCLRGEGAAYPAPKTARVLPFSTNASLSALVENLPIQPQVVFHAAALCDFLVHAIQGGPQARKIPSTAEVHIILRPAEKILPRLRRLFPEALIVGWKYELDGTRSSSIQRARQQIEASATDACVVNGSAYGEGFGFLRRASHEVQHLADKAHLSEFLAAWALEKLTPCSTSAKAGQFRQCQAVRSGRRKSPQ